MFICTVLEPHSICHKTKLFPEATRAKEITAVLSKYAAAKVRIFDMLHHLKDQSIGLPCSHSTTNNGDISLAVKNLFLESFLDG